MKNKMKSVYGILSVTTLLVSAKSEALNMESYHVDAGNAKELFKQRKLVGFAPSKAINTLEALSIAGASHFNEMGETEVYVQQIGGIVQAANTDQLRVNILPSKYDGKVLLKFFEERGESIELSSDQILKLRELTERYQLKCDGGTTDFL